MNTADFMTQNADRVARETLSNVRAALADVLAELDCHIARYESSDCLRNKADLINSTIRQLSSSMIGNIRLDFLARAQAALECVATAQLCRANQ
jgi:hypothetical protein